MRVGQIVGLVGKQGTWRIHRVYLDGRVDLFPHTAFTCHFGVHPEKILDSRDNLDS